MLTKKYIRSAAAIMLSVALAILVGGCGSSLPFGGSATGGSAETGISATALLDGVMQQYPRQEQFSASGRAVLRFGQKDVNTRVELTLVRGRGIRLVAMPFPLVVAGRAWITPEGVTVTDAINKRYVTASYSELSDLIGFELSYTAFESLFLARLFKADGSRVFASDLLLSTGAQQGHLISYKDARRIEYLSEIGANKRPLTMSIYDPASRYRLSTTYSAFGQGAGQHLPTALMLQVLHQGVVEGSLSLDLTKMKFEDISGSDVTPRINTATYSKMTLDDLSDLF